MSAFQQFQSHVPTFLAGYDAAGQDRVWAEMSERFRTFWTDRVMADDNEPIPDDECDVIIRMLDRNAKGNAKQSEAVARAMVPQGAWRRLLNRLHQDKALGRALAAVLDEKRPAQKAEALDRLYQLNRGDRNYLTGSSGNAVCAFLALFDPVANTSVISLKDRWALLDRLSFNVPVEKGLASVGVQIVQTNLAILDVARQLGLTGSARTASRFFYVPEVKVLWKGEHLVHVQGRTVSVAVPTEEPDEDSTGPEAAKPGFDLRSDHRGGAAAGEGDEAVVGAADEVRESMQIQALLAKIGAAMGFSIWLPRADRSRVLRAWSPGPGELLDALPLGYDATTTKTIEQIDVLWLRRRSIARAFEVEHTTSIYSGLLRMADLVALQPDINVKLHIVASVERQAKVLEEINRPVFAMLERRPLHAICTFLSYDHVREIAQLKHLARLPDSVLDDYEIAVEVSDDAL